jgi:hypothetical protein
VDVQNVFNLSPWWGRTTLSCIAEKTTAAASKLA